MSAAEEHSAGKDAERAWDEGHSSAFGHGKYLCACINKNPYRSRVSHGSQPQPAPDRWPETRVFPSAEGDAHE